MALAMIEGAERDGLISARRHDRRVHGRQHGPRARARLQGEGLPGADRDGRLLHRGALSADARARGGDRRRPVGRGSAEGDRAGHREHGRARRRARGAPGHYATDQFNNPYIIPDHRDRLGREIWEQTAGRVTAFCHGMGTASSVMGVSDALKPHGVFIQAHEPAESAAISGGERGPFLIQGWTGLVMPHWDPGQGRPPRADRRRGSGRDDASALARGGHLRRASRPARTWSARIASPSASALTQ